MGSTTNELEPEMDENNMKGGEVRRWSQLPSLPLWMIMERLNLSENVRLSAVCKDWNLVYESYPVNAQQKCVAPFFMYQLPQESTICFFVNMSTMEENIHLHIPDFHKGTTLMFSRQGWLLLHECIDTGPGKSSLYVVLLHVQTNAKIIMQAPEKGDVKKLAASFTFSEDGSPSRVILARCDGTNIIFYVREVGGDAKWMKCSFRTAKSISIRSCIILQKKVYCHIREGDLLIFDMSSFELKEVSGNGKWCWMIGYEEEGIMKVETDKDRKSFAFFKLNGSQTGWEELSERETAGRNWFISSTIGAKDNQYTVSEAAGTKKVYQLGSYLICGAEVTIRTSMSVHDLIDGTEKNYEVQKNGTGQWVDLGKIVKAPPLCLGYVPQLFHQYEG